MFCYIVYADGKLLIVNPNCCLTMLLSYVRLVANIQPDIYFDLCTKFGVLLGLPQESPRKNATDFMIPRASYYIVLFEVGRAGGVRDMRPYLATNLPMYKYLKEQILIHKKIIKKSVMPPPSQKNRISKVLRTRIMTVETQGRKGLNRLEMKKKSKDVSDMMLERDSNDRIFEQLDFLKDFSLTKKRSNEEEPESEIEKFEASQPLDSVANYTGREIQLLRNNSIDDSPPTPTRHNKHKLNDDSTSRISITSADSGQMKDSKHLPIFEDERMKYIDKSNFSKGTTFNMMKQSSEIIQLEPRISQQENINPTASKPDVIKRNVGKPEGSRKTVSKFEGAMHTVSKGENKMPIEKSTRVFHETILEKREILMEPEKESQLFLPSIDTIEESAPTPFSPLNVEEKESNSLLSLAKNESITSSKKPNQMTFQHNVPSTVHSNREGPSVPSDRMTTPVRSDLKVSPVRTDHATTPVQLNHGTAPARADRGIIPVLNNHELINAEKIPAVSPAQSDHGGTSARVDRGINVVPSKNGIVPAGKIPAATLVSADQPTQYHPERVATTVRFDQTITSMPLDHTIAAVHEDRSMESLYFHNPVDPLSSDHMRTNMRTDKTDSQSAPHHSDVLGNAVPSNTPFSVPHTNRTSTVSILPESDKDSGKLVQHHKIETRSKTTPEKHKGETNKVPEPGFKIHTRHTPSMDSLGNEINLELPLVTTASQTQLKTLEFEEKKKDRIRYEGEPTDKPNENIVHGSGPPDSKWWYTSGELWKTGGPRASGKLKEKVVQRVPQLTKDSQTEPILTGIDFDVKTGKIKEFTSYKEMLEQKPENGKYKVRKPAPDCVVAVRKLPSNEF